MKIVLAFLITGVTLFAGGDIRPDRVVVQKVVSKPADHQGCYKPDIQKCPDCEDVAELCPYNGEDIPLAQTEVCEGLVNSEASVTR